MPTLTDMPTLPTSPDLTASSTRWVRAPRLPGATRTDGLSLNFDGAAWVVAVNGALVALSTPGIASYLERAIEEVDTLHPPAPWTLASGVWWAGVWQVRPNGDGTWSVHRLLDGVVEAASRQPFPSADRARRWAELRFDRGDGRLRGPKPRAGSRASCKLPDVRVTEDERAHTVEVLERLGLGYSDFVRASLAWAEANVLSSAAGWQVVPQEEGGHAFLPVDAA